MRNARLRAVHARAEVLPTCLAAGFMGLTRRAAKGLRGVGAALALRPLRRCCGVRAGHDWGDWVGLFRPMSDYTKEKEFKLAS